MKSLKPLKKLGQNWLINPKILEFIVSAANIGPNDTVLEVGPGTGLLTEKLAETGAKIIAVEKDRRLVPALKEKFKNQKNVRIIESDILRFDLDQIKVEPWKYKLIGNIPYYLTSHLLRTVLEKWPKPKLILFTVQKEVAQRIVAKPPKMNMLALAVQFYAKAEIVKYISKGNFCPVPKVDSALIKIEPQAQTHPKTFTENFFKLAKAAYSGKRKQLLNSLSNNLKIDKKILSRALAQSGIAPTQRPESLSIEKWLKLTQLLFPEH